MGCSGCDWDPRKRATTWHRRRILFEDACCVFEDPNRIEVLDDRDFDEERWIATGRVGRIVLVVVFTDRNGRPWIISARKAEPREENAYYAQFTLN
jgi:uncharacterized DUF497 family protein